MGIKAVLTDIEGTTSSIAFVKQVLFPYASRCLADYVRRNRAEPAVKQVLSDTAEEAGLAPNDIEGQISTLLRWIDEDRKSTPLKTLQGLIWQEGYERGEYQAQVYGDAVTRMKAWVEQGYRIYVYSSGSVAAQRLFFRHSEAGDLTSLFSGYFDTTAGPKRESSSYAKIAAKVGLLPGEILFLSDIVEELDAAKRAGLYTCWVLRPGDSPISRAERDKGAHPWVESFLSIDPGQW